jgi:hypothetical protein
MTMERRMVVHPATGILEAMVKVIVTECLISIVCRDWCSDTSYLEAI